MAKMSQEVNSVKEKFENRQQIRRQHLTLYIILLVVAFSVIVITLYLYKKHSEELRLQQKYNELKEEFIFFPLFQSDPTAVFLGRSGRN